MFRRTPGIELDSITSRHMPRCARMRHFLAREMVEDLSTHKGRRPRYQASSGFRSHTLFLTLIPTVHILSLRVCQSHEHTTAVRPRYPFRPRSPIPHALRPDGSFLVGLPSVWIELLLHLQRVHHEARARPTWCHDPTGPSGPAKPFYGPTIRKAPGRLTVSGGGNTTRL